MGRCWSDAGPCGGVVRCGGWSRDILVEHLEGGSLVFGLDVAGEVGRHAPGSWRPAVGQNMRPVFPELLEDVWSSALWLHPRESERLLLVEMSQSAASCGMAPLGFTGIPSSIRDMRPCYTVSAFPGDVCVC